MSAAVETRSRLDGVFGNHAVGATVEKSPAILRVRNKPAFFLDQNVSGTRFTDQTPALSVENSSLGTATAQAANGFDLLQLQFDLNATRYQEN